MVVYILEMYYWAVTEKAVVLLCRRTVPGAGDCVKKSVLCRRQFDTEIERKYSKIVNLLFRAA